MELTEVKNYLRVDYDEDDELITLLMEVATEYVTNGFGTFNNVKASHKILYLKAIKTLYDNRGDSKDKISLSVKLQQMLGDDV